MKNTIYPVILAGGSGTRLWPRSREKQPKQFMELINGKSLFQETCLRFSDTKKFPFLTIITHEDHRFLVRDQLRDINITDACVLTEPIAKNTLAACLSASFFLLNKVGDVPIVFAPADHIITDEKNLFTAFNNALPFVKNGKICIFGIEPDSPHTGYGYIREGKKLAKGITLPKSFIEKPNKEKAEKLIQEKALWNAGIYLSTANTLLKEAKKFTPKIEEDLRLYFKKNLAEKSGFYMISKEVFSTIESISIDNGITEHTKKLIVAKTKIQWSDLGSWGSLYTHFRKNKDGNIIKGDVIVESTKNSYIESTSRLVATLGVRDIGLIETPDAVLLFSLQEGESIKKIVKTLSEKKREEIVTHTTVHRPWGMYQILGSEKNFQSKKITVLPGAELSLQRHKKRAEHWVVVSGTATVTINDKVFILKENESTFIPIGAKHKLENNHTKPLCIIEIQTGKYFGEDDIERFSDSYGRV